VTCIVLVGCNALTGVSELGVSGESASSDVVPPSVPVPSTTSTSSSADPSLPRADAADANRGPDADASQAADVAQDSPIVKDAAADVIVGPPPGAKRAFVTSVTSSGNLGGFAGADTLCKTRATAASLGGTWVAWLSNGKANGTHAVNRLTSTGPWYLLSGAVVAADKATLTSGALTHAIDRNELNQVVADTAWTGTGANGRYLHHACGAWGAATQNGRYGSTSAVDGTWTAAADGPCTVSRRVYCFEQ
jgi:hypothetical protein